MKSISNKQLDKIKSSLRDGNDAYAIEILQQATNVSLLSVFEEQKLLLYLEDNSDIINAYESASKRILNLVDFNYKSNYIQFLNHYKEVTAKLKSEIRTSISSLIGIDIKQFLIISDGMFKAHLVKMMQTFYEELSKNQKGLVIDTSDMVSINERMHHELSGRVNDLTFAYVRLINLFVGWNNGKERFEIVEIDEDKVFDALIKCANLNSYQYAFDKVSYGEWIVESIETNENQSLFTFKIIDILLQKSRVQSIRRNVAHTFIKRKGRWLSEVLKGFAELALNYAWDFYKDKSSLVFDDNGFSKAGKRMQKALDMLDAEDELLLASDDNKAILSTYLGGVVILSFNVASEVLAEKLTHFRSKLTFPEIPQFAVNELLTLARES